VYETQNMYQKMVILNSVELSVMVVIHVNSTYSLAVVSITYQHRKEQSPTFDAWRASRGEQRSAKLAFVALLATRHTSFPFHCSTEAVPKTACEKAEVCSVLQIVVSLYINSNPIDSTLSTHRRATLPNTPTPQPLCCQLPSSSHIKSAQQPPSSRPPPPNKTQKPSDTSPSTSHSTPTVPSR
jgi:hypothetical protein